MGLVVKIAAPTWSDTPLRYHCAAVRVLGVAERRALRCVAGGCWITVWSAGFADVLWTVGRVRCIMLRNLSARRRAVAKLGDYLKISDAAAYLGVHPDTLRRWDRAGKLKARRHPVNRFRLYLRSDLDKLLGQLGASPNISWGSVLEG